MLNKKEMPLEFRSVLEAKKLSSGTCLQVAIRVKIIPCNLICLTLLTRAKCGVRSTLCWKIPNISGSIKLFAL